MSDSKAVISNKPISNKIIVSLYLESGCSQDDDEVQISWSPINFLIYDKLFIDIIYESISEWLSMNNLEFESRYELIMGHEIERDGGGAVHTEYFDVLSVEMSREQ